MGSRLENQIKLLEQMEKVSEWIIGTKPGEYGIYNATKRHLRCILKCKYRRLYKLAKKNIQKKDIGSIPKLKKYRYYREKAGKNVTELFRDSVIYGAGLEMQNIFDRHRKVHGFYLYEDFLRHVDEFSVFDKESVCYLNYLNDLKTYLICFMKIKYPQRIKKLKIYKGNVLEKINLEELIRTEVLESDKDARSPTDFCSTKVYCVPCRVYISKNVFKFHVSGKRHVQRHSYSEEGVLYQRVSTQSVENEIKQMLTMLNKERKHSIGILCPALRTEIKTSSTPKWIIKQKETDILFECSICGYSENGKAAFDIHFSGNRHAEAVEMHGMKNSETLRGITKVSTLMKIKSGTGNDEKWEEEFEDDDGNVFDKATYEDLKRNNLI